jgi:hypothetical protein
MMEPRKMNTQMRTSLFIGIAVALMAAAAPSGPTVSNFSRTKYRLQLEGRITDKEERSLEGVKIRVDTNGVLLGRVQADEKGRFVVMLDIGHFYGFSVEREGFAKKRFIIDARTEDPSTVVAGPFHADISLNSLEKLASVDPTILDFPYAMVTYSAKDRAFIADPAYIEEMKRVEAALMLGAAYGGGKRTSSQ